MPYSSGGVTKNIFRYGPEVHKLHLEFTVKAGETIHRGQPVKLNADGTISVVDPTDAELVFIGVSIHEGGSAYGKDFVVVAMRAYAVVDAVAKGVVPAGAVGYAGFRLPATVAGVYPQPNISDSGAHPSWDTSIPDTQGDSQFAAAAVDGTAVVLGWSLTNAKDAEPILVAIKN